jgi:hypothetical protein
MKLLRRRFWVVAPAALSAYLLLGLTLVSPHWIETLFHVDPDGGSGQTEWVIVALQFAIAGTLSVLTLMEWRRPPRQLVRDAR